jgi:hypothetical protein
LLARVCRVRVNPETFTLDPDDIERAITDKTKLVAVGLASNAVAPHVGYQSFSQLPDPLKKVLDSSARNKPRAKSRLAQSAASPERRRGMLKPRWGISLCYPIAIHWRRFS